MSTYQPVGTRFFSRSRNQEMILVSDGPYKDWLCYRHPDGQWVTLRKAKQADLDELAKAMLDAFHH